MELHFVGKNIEVTPPMKDYATEKFGHLKTRYQHITNVNIVFHVEHAKNIVDATVYIDGTELHASSEHDDMYAAIDAAAKILTTQLTKHKDKIIDSHHHQQPPISTEE